MTLRLRSPSLFWTFAGSFLLVLIVATVLQGLVVGAVIRPLVTRWVDARAELITREAARALVTHDTLPDDAEIESILRAAGGDARDQILVFRAADGRMFAERPLPRMARRFVEVQLSGEEPGGFPRPGRRRSRPGGPADSLGRGKDRAPMRLLSRTAVERGEAIWGEVVLLAPPPPRFPLWPPAAPRPLLLFLPLAMLIAGAAGLILFRILIRRLRALEALATRVTEGDLTARVKETSGDEIGLLGKRLNAMTESLAEARTRVEQTETQRRRFLADISHELATPLTTIRGYTETLLDPKVPVSPEEHATYLRHVLTESERMNLLINDLFELTRLEGDMYQLDRDRLDLSALCKNTIDRLRPVLEDRGLSLVWEGAAEETWVHADGRRLEQVIENLLMNAVRHVPHDGRVEVSVAPSAAGDRVRLTVRDNGPGIPERDLPFVFDRFYRADSARGGEGTGLGLAIVQEIIRRHDGTVSAVNLDPGAAFVIELPA